MFKVFWLYLFFKKGKKEFLGPYILPMWRHTFSRKVKSSSLLF